MLICWREVRVVAVGLVNIYAGASKFNLTLSSLMFAGGPAAKGPAQRTMQTRLNERWAQTPY
jgi:hypothetical protein